MEVPTDSLFVAGMDNSKQWFGFCNYDRPGGVCGLILGNIDKKVTIPAQNDTFADCIGPGSNCRTRPWLATICNVVKNHGLHILVYTFNKDCVSTYTL